MPHPLLIICHTHSLYSIIIIGMPGMPPGMPPGMRPMAPGLLAAPGMMPPVPPGTYNDMYYMLYLIFIIVSFAIVCAKYIIYYNV